MTVYEVGVPPVAAAVKVTETDELPASVAVPIVGASGTSVAGVNPALRLLSVTLFVIVTFSP